MIGHGSIKSVCETFFLFLYLSFHVFNGFIKVKYNSILILRTGKTGKQFTHLLLVNEQQHFRTFFIYFCSFVMRVINVYSVTPMKQFKKCKNKISINFFF